MTDRNIEAIHPLTPLQEGILFHTLDHSTPGVYFNQFSCLLTGDLDDDLLRRCWGEAVGRHAPLRTLFTWEKRSQPLQIVRGRVELPWQSLDWRDADADAQAARLEAWLARDRDRGFVLDRAPLIRLALIRLSERRWRLVWSFHHIILDGWSVRLVLDEVLSAYRARRNGRDPQLPPAPAFDSFLHWLAARDDSRDEAFWRERLAGFDMPSTPEIVLSGAAGGPASAPSVMTGHTVDRGVTARLREFARGGRVTLASAVAAAWAVVLARYCDRDDVVFGATVAGRPPDLAGAERMAGLFINTLPLRVRVADDDTVIELCRRVMRTQGEQRDFEQTPLQSIRRWSDVEGPLFDTILVFENLPEPARDGAGEDALQAAEPRFIEYSNFPLALLVVPGEALQLIAVHQQDRYSIEAVERLLAHVEHILAQFAGSGSMRASELSLVTPAEQRWLTDTLNDTQQPIGDGSDTVADWFERCVDASPDAVAIATAEGSVSYAALDERANRIAGRLLEETADGDPVVIYSARSADAFAAMLGALKAGRPYVPLDAGDSGGRLAQVLADLRRCAGETDPAPLVLTQADRAAAVAKLGARPIALDGEPAPGGAPRPGRRLDTDAPAYVIYTSGSTGEPKGVLVSHANLVNSTGARLARYDEPPSAYALLSSLATDSAIAGIYWTLCTGGTLVIPGDRAELDVAALAALIEDRGVTHLLGVPSLYALLLEHADTTRLKSLKIAIVAGEACTGALVARHFAALPDTRLYNEYGPSEACVWASVDELTAADADTGVTIGRPIANTRLYVLDHARRPLPAGVAGELYIGGANVAIGYLGRDELTAATFVPDPFAGDGSRLYRTGDRARVRGDGRIEFVGRVDQQIKVRGFRVEPGEIEATLTRHPEVDAAAVFLEAAGQRDDGRAIARKLVAVVTPAAGAIPDAGELRRHCQARLADHMVPQIIAIEDALPKTPAGKIDRRELAARHWSAPAPDAGNTIEPVTATERTLAAIWSEVLGVERVGVNDNFFEIGGDSLLTIRILSRAAKAGLNLSPAAFFAEPTVAGQARAADAASPVAAERGPVTGPLPLTPIQHWFFDTIRTDVHQWNQSVLLEIAPGLPTDQLDRALQALLLHHDALRTRFPLADGARRAEIADLPAELPLHRIDARDDRGDALAARIAEVAAQLNAGFDLADAPLLRCAHFGTADGEPDQLLVIIHHLVVDAESWRMILGDFATVLEQLGAGGSPSLPPKTASIRTWARRLEEFAGDPAAAEHRRYWHAAMPDALTPLPTDLHADAAADTEDDVRIVTTELEADQTGRLTGAARGTGRAGVFELLVTAFAAALADWTGAPLVAFDTEGHGREPLFDDVDVSRTVGWFTSTYPIVLRVDDTSTWQDPLAAVRAVRDHLRAIPQHGIGFGILRELAGDSQLRSAPTPDVLFNFLGQTDPDEAGALRVLDERCGPARSPRCERAYRLQVNARIAGGRLSMEWRYSRRRHREETIERLAAACLAMLRSIADGADDAAGQPASATDFPLAGIGQEHLDSIAAQLAALDDD